MNAARCLCVSKFNYSYINLRIISRTLSSTGVKYEQSESSVVQDERYQYDDLNIADRVERRKAAIRPFMKDVFTTKVNTELLAYPEVLNKDETEELNGRISTILSVLNDNTEPSDKKLTLGRARFFGAPLTPFEGGLSTNVTERLRFLETISSDVELFKQISSHWISLQALKLGFAGEHNHNFIKDISTGDITASICFKETVSDNVKRADIRTVAVRENDDVWIVNGEKIKPNCTDGYLITLGLVDAGRIRAFLIEPNAPGVEFTDSSVKFRDTPAKAFGETNNTDDTSKKVLNNSLNYARLDTSVLAYSLLKHALEKIVPYVRGKYVSGKPLADMPLIRKHVSKAVLACYTAESMAYFTAGLLDGYLEPDAEIEMAMCRTHATENGFKAMAELLTVAGVDSLSEEWSFYFNSMRSLLISSETNDMLNLIIALHGLQHVGKEISVEISKQSNPFKFSGMIFKQVLGNRNQSHDNPKLTLHLDEHLHPSLQLSARSLEYCVFRLNYASELLISRHGEKLSDAHCDLNRLGKIATEIYAMIAVISRASRSYCIGLRNAEVEMRLAMATIEISTKVVKSYVSDIENGEYLNLDVARLEFGKRVLEDGRLPFENAIEFESTLK